MIGCRDPAGTNWAHPSGTHSGLILPIRAGHTFFHDPGILEAHMPSANLLFLMIFFRHPFILMRGDERV